MDESGTPSAAGAAGGRAAIEAELTGARPDLSPNSPEFLAALLLLNIADRGLNVDRLIMRTRLPREFVARSARRLVDSGVWGEGQLTAPWVHARARSPEFWLDVEVALGRMQRHTREDGVIEWLDPGARPASATEPASPLPRSERNEEPTSTRPPQAPKNGDLILGDWPGTEWLS